MNFDHAYFEQDRKTFQKLDISKSIYLTKPECENIGLYATIFWKSPKKTLISPWKKNLRCPQKFSVSSMDRSLFPCNASLCSRARAIRCKWIECYPNNPKSTIFPQTTGLLVLNDVLSGVLMSQ